MQLKYQGVCLSLGALELCVVQRCCSPVSGAGPSGSTEPGEQEGWAVAGVEGPRSEHRLDCLFWGLSPGL